LSSDDRRFSATGRAGKLGIGWIDAQNRFYGYGHARGLDGLAMLVQGVLEQDPFSGHLFAFRSRKANLIKIVFWK
jgi:hypothetical protein